MTTTQKALLPIIFAATKPISEATNQSCSHSTGCTSRLYNFVEEALQKKGRMPCTRPELAYDLHNYEVASFHLEASLGGSAAVITFKDVPAGLKNAILITEPASKKKAFMFGAAILCYILTGSYKLPFIVAGNRLVIVGYDTAKNMGLFVRKLEVNWDLI